MSHSIKHLSLVSLLLAALGGTTGFPAPARGQTLPSGIDAMPILAGPSLLPTFADELEAEAGASAQPPWWSVQDWSRKQKVIALNAAAIGTILAIGFAGWDYGSHSFQTADEDWFASGTPYGGADKFGHMFSCYALTSIFNRMYQQWGYESDDALLIGAATSWLTMSAAEIGDGFSNSQGFSYEDEIMNTIGVGMAYLRHRFPAVRERVDFRMEWFPSPAVRHGDRFDLFTDYSGQKYLLAFKLDGWLRTGNPTFKALELQVGYYTRGYGDEDEHYFDGKHRYGYIGLGLNVTYLLEKYTGHRAWGLFDYYQVPYTYLPARWEY